MKKLLKVTLILISSAMLAFLYFYSKNIAKQLSTKLVINSVSPAPNSIGVEFDQPIELDFAYTKADISKVNLAIEPAIGLVKEREGMKLIFKHEQPFQSLSYYRISITHADQSKPLTQWSFRTKSVPGDDPTLSSLDEYNQTYYPLLAYLPKKTSQYEVQYVGKLHLKIIIYNPNIERAKSSALEFLSSTGVDTSNHEISWVEIPK